MSRLVIVFIGLLLVVGCSGAPSPSPSPIPSATSGLYLRAWQTQALPPPSNFSSGPYVTVAEGALIDDNVAVPAIFPGPLLTLPVARPITPAGEQQIVDQLHDLGLLDGATDFTGGGVPPGGATGHLLLIIEGTRHELSGDPAAVRMCGDRPCAVDPATPEAFAAFWWLLGNTDNWLGGNLGQSVQYQPEHLGVLVIAPVTDNSGLGTNSKNWPLAAFASFGDPFAGVAGAHCAVVSGNDLAKLLPVLLASNQLTVFADASGERHSVNVRAIVPLEDSPCTAS